MEEACISNSLNREKDLPASFFAYAASCRIGCTMIGWGEDE